MAASSWKSKVLMIGILSIVVCLVGFFVTQDSAWFGGLLLAVVVCFTAAGDIAKDAKKSRAVEVRQLVEDCLSRGVLPVAKCPLLLQKDEQCHFLARGAWCEMRTAKSGSYSGVSFSVPIVRGVRYRVGSYSHDTRRELKEIDTGTLYLTNQRLIFNGEQRNAELALTKLVQVRVGSDAIAFERSKGEHVAFKTPDPETLAMVVLAAAGRS